MVTIVGVSGSSHVYHVDVARMKVVVGVWTVLKYDPMEDKIPIKPQNLLGESLMVLGGAEKSIFPYGMLFYTNMENRVCIAPVPSVRSLRTIADNRDMFQSPMKIDDIFRLLEFME